MSLLDIDERILTLAELVDFDKSPIDDFKEIQEQCADRPDRGRVLQRGERARAARLPEAVRHPRSRWETAPPWAASRRCGTSCPLRGVPARRPTWTVPRSTTRRGEIPANEEIPLLLDRVYPAHEVVKIDYHLPGCPPSADTLWAALTALLSDEPVELPYSLIKYD